MICVATRSQHLSKRSRTKLITYQSSPTVGLPVDCGNVRVLRDMVEPMLRDGGDTGRFMRNRRRSFCGLPRGVCLDQRFESVAFRFHTNVAVVLEHIARDVAGDIHNRLLTSSALRKIGDESVTVIVPTTRHLGVPPHSVPSRLERCHRSRGVAGPRLTEGEEIPLGSSR
jgi:hypothetical protein